MRVWLLLLLLIPMPMGMPQGLDDIDELLGQGAGRVAQEFYNQTGQNLSREDVRIRLELNFTKGDVDVLGLLIGAGQAEVMAKVDLRVEMRVISLDRIRSAVEGEDPLAPRNATAFSSLYIPAEVFRRSAAAETIAAFQRDQEASLAQWLEDAVPELDVLGLDVKWSNTNPIQRPEDPDLVEPPIVFEADATVQYLRTETLAGLLKTYWDKRDEPKDPKRQQIEELKAEHGDPMRTRDFFAAAAYTQLLNLSMQPGWSLAVELNLPKGYSFTYFNDNVEVSGERTARFDVEAEEEENHEVVMASITHRRAVALTLMLGVLAIGLMLAFPGRLLYQRLRVPHIAAGGQR